MGKKFLFVFMIILFSSSAYTDNEINSKKSVIHDKKLVFSEKNEFLKSLHKNNLLIPNNLEIYRKSEFNTKILPKLTELNDILQNKKTDAYILSNTKQSNYNSIYQYNNYIKDDLVGTSGNGIRENLMVATPVENKFCMRPNVGETTIPLEEGILFITSDTYRDSMYQKEYPLNMFQFRNIFSSNILNLNIKNTIPYSNSFTTPSNFYIVSYHNYLPLQIIIKTYHTNGAGFAYGNPSESSIIGCYSLKYDGGNNLENGYYWLSLHKNTIYKDILFAIETIHILNIENYNRNSNIQPNMLKNYFINLVRQGEDTDWTSVINQALNEIISE